MTVASHDEDGKFVRDGKSHFLGQRWMSRRLFWLLAYTPRLRDKYRQYVTHMGAVEYLPRSVKGYMLGREQRKGLSVVQ